MTTASISLPTDPAAPSAMATPSAQAGYGVSLTDLGAFEQALARAGSGQAATLQAHAVRAPNETMQALFKPLEHINAEASTLSSLANAANQASRGMTPGEIVTLTVRCQEFMFHCQLTSNAANRTSDGLQQLFRQQA